MANPKNRQKFNERDVREQIARGAREERDNTIKQTGHDPGQVATEKLWRESWERTEAHRTRK